MTYVVTTISLEQEINKKQMVKCLFDAINFIKSHSKERIIICENSLSISLVFKSESENYFEIQNNDQNRILIPVIEFETGAEELIENSKYEKEKHILLTTFKPRRHDKERNDLSVLTEKPINEACTAIADVLEKEGLFYE